MTIGVLLYGLAAGVLGAAGGWALARVTRLAGQPERPAWVGALVVVTALSLLPFLMAAVGEAPPESFGTYRAVAEFGPERGDRSELLPIDGATPIPAAGTIWLGLSSGLLLLGLATEVRQRRRLGGLRPMRTGGMTIWLSASEGPAVCGILRPLLVVPERVLELDSEAKALILAHEAEHLRAGDPLVHALSWLAVVVVPWNPLVWWLRRRVARALESDCDRRALARSGADPREYAELLITVASWDLGVAMAPLRLAMGRSARELRDRIERVLRPTPHGRSGAIAGLLLLAVGAAAPALADPPAAYRANVVGPEVPAGVGVLTPRGSVTPIPDDVQESRSPNENPRR